MIHLRRLRFETLPAEAYGGLTRQQIHATLKARELIAPDNITVIVGHQIAELYSQGYRAIVVDGFPRSDECAEIFEAKVSLSICLDPRSFTTANK